MSFDNRFLFTASTTQQKVAIWAPILTGWNGNPSGREEAYLSYERFNTLYTIQPLATLFVTQTEYGNKLIDAGFPPRYIFNISQYCDSSNPDCTFTCGDLEVIFHYTGSSPYYYTRTITKAGTTISDLSNCSNVFTLWSFAADNNGKYPHLAIDNLQNVPTQRVEYQYYSDGHDTNIYEGLTPNQDPYDGAGDSTTGGGDGNFDGSSDPVGIPSLPTVGATNTGFISLFVPSEAQLRQVASYMWSSLFDISTFYKLFEDPMDCILGLSVVPVAVPTSGNAQITVGNIELSGITLPLASQQYVEVDCGSISFANKYFGSYLDYEPYTKMAIFLPYCGTHQINADDIMGKTVSVKYHIDILTGSCVAFVKCGDSVLYEYNGACASNIPVNSINYASTIENAIRIAVNIGTTVATAGASAPISGATEALTTAQNIGRGISLAGSTAEGALSLKPNIARSGALGGSVGILGNQTPYIIITRPRLCKPKNQDFFEGYPSFIQTTIGDLVGKGYTSFTDVVISSQYLTDAEEQELEGILKGGVYL